MARKFSTPLKMHHIRLIEGDFEQLQELYPQVTANEVIRTLVHKHIKAIKERAQHEAAPLPTPEIPHHD